MTAAQAGGPRGGARGRGGVTLPWQRSTYSGRFLRAVCTTSKFPLPRQYMNVGRNSVAMLITRGEETGRVLLRVLWVHRGAGIFRELREGRCLPGVVLDAAQG